MTAWLDPVDDDLYNQRIISVIIKLGRARIFDTRAQQHDAAQQAALCDGSIGMDGLWRLNVYGGSSGVN